MAKITLPQSEITTKRWLKRSNILEAATTASTGEAINVASYKNINLSVGMTGFTGTIKVQGSLSLEKPDFSDSATSSNRWDYVAVFNYNDPTTVITGSTGISGTTSTLARNLLVNVDGLNWLCVTVTSASAGSVSVDLIAMDNS